MKFSILTTCYNYKSYIGQAIESFLIQDYPDKEMIIVDDFSEDGSFDVIQQYAKLHSNIICHRTSSRFFCAGAYNMALRMATGDICGVIDGDDILSQKDAISIMVDKYTKNSHLSYIYSQFYWCNDKLEKCRKGFSDLPLKKCSLAETFLRGKHAFSHWRTFRTKCRDKKLLFPLGMKFGVDKQLGFNLEEVGPGGFLNIPLYKYRFHGSNMTHYAIGKQKSATLQQAREVCSRRRNQKIKCFSVEKVK